jgi:predicted glutamine amidotransferase
MWSDESFASLAGVVESGCVLAGVRSASIGMPVEVTATAPFMAGRLLFGHNGFVPDAAALRSLLPPGAVPESRVDSALLWTLVTARLDQGASLDAALADVVTSVARITTGRMNLFLTDGFQLAATAWGDTLWIRSDPAGVLVASEPDTEAEAGPPDTAQPDTARTDTAQTDTAQTNTVQPDPAQTGGWQELPDRTVLIVEHGRTTTSALGGAALKGIA